MIQNHRLLILPVEQVVFVVEACPLANKQAAVPASWHKVSANRTRVILEIGGSSAIELRPNELKLRIVEPLAARVSGVELHRTATYARAVVKFLNEKDGVDLLAIRVQRRVVV